MIITGTQMIITEARYVNAYGSDEAAGIFCAIDGVETSVPINPENRHYAEIMRQVEAGELTIQEAD